MRWNTAPACPLLRDNEGPRLLLVGVATWVYGLHPDLRRPEKGDLREYRLPEGMFDVENLALNTPNERFSGTGDQSEQGES